MNVKQLILLSVVVVALVFLVTFATQYLGGNSEKNSGPKPVPGGQHLVFDKTKLDLDKEPMPIHEWHKRGHHDFWFRNETGGRVQMGLASKSCKCSKVEVCVFPEEKWKDLDAKGREGLAQDRETDWQPLVEHSQDRKGITVPPGGAGWLRLGWESEKIGEENLRAAVWTQLPSGEISNPPIDLFVPVLFVHPVFCVEEERSQNPVRSERKQDEKYIGKLGAGESAQACFLLFSLMRSDFEVDPEPSKTACVEIVKPQKLSEKERKEMSTRFGVPVLCAYRAVVTVREQVGDKSQLDLGLFRYRIGLRTNADMNPDAFVLGEVEGPVAVETDELQRSRIMLGKFSGREDREVDIHLFATDRQLEMKLDSERTLTPFFQVKEPEEVRKERVGKTWRVELKIPAGTVEGVFPDRSKEPKPGYEDCAVYLLVRRKPDPKSKTEEPWRRIRIPIYGEATRD